MTTAKPFPEWNDGSIHPPNEMLVQRTSKTWSAMFVVDYGDGNTTVDWFHRTQKTDGTWYQGYWEHDAPPVKRWMQLPE